MIVNKDTGANKDTSAPPLRTQDIDRNDPKIHRAITEATISRTAWVEEPRPENRHASYYCGWKHKIKIIFYC
jgi:hypothetical protein